MKRAVPLLALILSACAGLDATGCRAANWYEVGFRDAIYAMHPWSPTTPKAVQALVGHLRAQLSGGFDV